MGYGITPYVVPLAELRAACGSKRRKVSVDAVEDCRELVARLDESWREDIGRGGPDAATAVRMLVDGASPADGAFSFALPYALEVLCCHLGMRLDAYALGRTTTTALRRIDTELRAQGVDAFSISNFTDGPAPVVLPPHGPFPGVGTMEPDAVRRGLAQLEKIRRKDPDTDGEAVSSALEELTQWLAAASAVRGGGLVCFYY